MSKLVKNNYPTPTIVVEELEVERGFLLSSDYGEMGEAGQKSGYLENDYDL